MHVVVIASTECLLLIMSLLFIYMWIMLPFCTFETQATLY